MMTKNEVIEKYIEQHTSNEVNIYIDANDFIDIVDDRKLIFDEYNIDYHANPYELNKHNI